MSAQQPDPQQPQQPQSARKQRSLPGYQQTPKPQAEPDALRQMPVDEFETAILQLMELDYGQDGLTRDQIRKHYRDLPEAIYLRMPSSRRFLSAEEALRDVVEARSRAEGDFMGAQPDIPEQASVDDGGPPAWGGDPLFTLDGVEDGGSAEDTRGLLQADADEDAQGDGRITDRDR
ncbi:MAG TPA: hypothetical protein VIC27_11365 [Ktedonobacterales bacterium]